MIRVCIVCHGNICRSPMGMFMLRDAARGLDVEVTSAGVSVEEQGNGLDRRAARTLAAHDVPTGPHAAHRITDEDLAADLILVMTTSQLRRLHQLAPQHAGIRLITDFASDVAAGTEIDDPWYGGQDDFERCFAELAACLPGIVELLAHPSTSSGTETGDCSGNETGGRSGIVELLAHPSTSSGNGTGDCSGNETGGRSGNETDGAA